MWGAEKSLGKCVCELWLDKTSLICCQSILKKIGKNIICRCSLGKESWCSTCLNQNYNKILEHDWLSAARFEHQLDSTHHASNWTVHVILHALLRCSLSKLLFFIHNNVLSFSAQSMVCSFLEFCHSFD